MGFWNLLEVSSMPILQVIVVSGLGAFLATDFCNILGSESRKSINKIVFMVFAPSLIFSSLAKTVTFEDIISWWFMPLNTGLTFLFGGMMGWILVWILKPEKHMEGLIVAICSSGNLGNLILIIASAICHEVGSPFGDTDTCLSSAIPYASFSMAIGGLFIWTYTYHLIRTSAVKFKESQVAKLDMDLCSNNNKTPLLSDKEFNNYCVGEGRGEVSLIGKTVGFLHHILEELMSPPTLAAIAGLVVGAISWLRDLIIGDAAPLHFVEDAVKLLGDGSLPCVTLILGGNLTRGLRSSKVKPGVIIGVITVRYVLMPLVGVGVVKTASYFGFLPKDILFYYVLMIQFTLPPAMGIGTMTQLVGVAQEECSVIFMWTYLFAVPTLTLWPTLFIYILSP